MEIDSNPEKSNRSSPEAPHLKQVEYSLSSAYASRDAAFRARAPHNDAGAAATPSDAPLVSTGHTGTVARPRARSARRLSASIVVTATSNFQLAPARIQFSAGGALKIYCVNPYRNRPQTAKKCPNCACGDLLAYGHQSSHPSTGGTESSTFFMSDG